MGDTVAVDRADLKRLLDVMSKPLSMPTSSTIADWLQTPEMVDIVAPCRRLEAALKGTGNG